MFFIFIDIILLEKAIKVILILILLKINNIIIS
jgi:hypothetical protein